MRNGAADSSIYSPRPHLNQRSHPRRRRRPHPLHPRPYAARATTPNQYPCRPSGSEPVSICRIQENRCRSEEGRAGKQATRRWGREDERSRCGEGEGCAVRSQRSGGGYAWRCASRHRWRRKWGGGRLGVYDPAGRFAWAGLGSRGGRYPLNESRVECYSLYFNTPATIAAYTGSSTGIFNPSHLAAIELVSNTNHPVNHHSHSPTSAHHPQPHNMYSIQLIHSILKYTHNPTFPARYDTHPASSVRRTHPIIPAAKTPKGERPAACAHRGKFVRSTTTTENAMLCK